MELGHKNRDHVFLRIDRESSVEESSPLILPGTAQLMQRRLLAVYAEAETEPLIGKLGAKLIMRH